MANRTDKEVNAIHGTDPQNLVDYIVRKKIYDSLYWKEHCFGLNAETIVDRAVDLKELGASTEDLPPAPLGGSCSDILTTSAQGGPMAATESRATSFASSSRCCRSVWTRRWPSSSSVTRHVDAGHAA